MPNNDNRALAVAAGVGLLAAGGTVWWLTRPKAAPRPPGTGAVSAVGLPNVTVVVQEGGFLSVMGLPSLVVLMQEAGALSEVGLPGLAVLV